MAEILSLCFHENNPFTQNLKSQDLIRKRKKSESRRSMKKTKWCRGNKSSQKLTNWTAPDRFASASFLTTSPQLKEREKELVTSRRLIICHFHLSRNSLLSSPHQHKALTLCPKTTPKTSSSASFGTAHPNSSSSALLLLFTIATFLQFLPHPLHSPSPSDLRLCLTSSLSSSTTTPPPSPSQSTSAHPLPTTASPAPSPPLITTPTEIVLENGILKRSFRPYGAAAYNFILMGAYRGGLNTFAIIGLSSKPLHSFASPSYQCDWRSNKPNVNDTVVTVSGKKMLTDWRYGRVYTVVIVNCTFADNVGVDGFGGVLVLEASTGVVIIGI